MFVLAPDSTDYRFPPVELASPEGLLAVGGDLRCERLLSAYRHGVFPWYNEGQPILWWSPDPRAVLYPDRLKISRSLAKTLRARKFRVSFDRAFEAVIRACTRPRPRHPEGGTWITPEMRAAYCALHRQGYAHSVECWQDGALVGGLYGVALGRAFFGESMFSFRSDASKVALVHLVRRLQGWGYRLIDCQLPSPHLERLGARNIRRRDFMAQLEEALRADDRARSWLPDSPDVTVAGEGAHAPGTDPAP